MKPPLKSYSFRMVVCGFFFIFLFLLFFFFFFFFLGCVFFFFSFFLDIPALPCAVQVAFPLTGFLSIILTFSLVFPSTRCEELVSLNSFHLFCGYLPF